MTPQPHDDSTAASPEELREQVERTRHELGDTVQALAGKADVKGRTQAKAAELKEQTASKAADLGGQAKAKATEAAHALQEKVPDAVKERVTTTTEQVKAKADQAEQVWQDNAPEQVRNHRTVLLAGASAVLVAWLLLRRKKR